MAAAAPGFRPIALTERTEPRRAAFAPPPTPSALPNLGTVPEPSPSPSLARPATASSANATAAAPAAPAAPARAVRRRLGPRRASRRDPEGASVGVAATIATPRSTRVAAGRATGGRSSTARAGTDSPRPVSPRPCHRGGPRCLDAVGAWGSEPHTARACVVGVALGMAPIVPSLLEDQGVSPKRGAPSSGTAEMRTGSPAPPPPVTAARGEPRAPIIAAPPQPTPPAAPELAQPP